MSWMVRAEDYGKDLLVVQEALCACAITEAAAGKLDRRVALMFQEDDAATIYWLLSPAASKYVDMLPGEWVPISDAPAGRWRLAYSAGSSIEELGVLH